jgi:hypothetical protein
MADEVNASGEISITLDAEYVLRPSYAAINEIEERTGRSIIELANAAATGTLKLKESATICAAFMRAWGKEATGIGDEVQAACANANDAKVGELVYDAGLPKINTRIAIVLIGAATGGYTSAGKAKAAAE